MCTELLLKKREKNNVENHKVENIVAYHLIVEVPGAVVVVLSVGARETWERLLASDELPSGCSMSGEKQGGFVEEEAGREGASRASDRLTRTFFPT